MSVDELRLMVQVCKMYYLDDLSQNEIANRLYVSRPKVSKLITKAKKQNIVSFNINDPFSKESIIGEKLKERYHLDDAVIIDTSNMSREEAYASIAINMSSLFTSRVVNGNNVGISAGYTVASCAQHMNIYNCNNLKFIPLIAGESFEGNDWYANNNCMKFANRFGGKYMLLNIPMVIRDQKLQNQIKSNESIMPVLNLYNKLDVILLGIGQTTLKSTLGASPIGKEEISWAYEHGVKAVIGASYIDAGGNEVLKNKSDVYIGIKAQQIKKCKNVIAIGIGLNKIEAIKATLKEDYINVLCTNYETAEGLMT